LREDVLHFRQAGTVIGTGIEIDKLLERFEIGRFLPFRGA
jgi:hypothetical protein